MKELYYEDMAQNPAYRLMRGAAYGPGSVNLLALNCRAALLSGMPAQYVLQAAEYIYQSEVVTGDVRKMSLPYEVSRIFLDRAKEYAPSPVDVSHVEVTGSMRAAIGASTEALLRRSVNGSLSILDTDTAESVVKAAAALGGVSAQDLDSPDVWRDKMLSLGEYIHDEWARKKMNSGARYGVERTENSSGKELTHPDLVPFRDQTDEAKAPELDAAGVVLNAIHDEGLVIEPQLSQAAKDEALRKEEERRQDIAERAAEDLFAKVESEYDKVPLEFNTGKMAEVRDRIAQDALIRDIRNRPGNVLLPGPEMVAEGVAKMAPFPADVLVAPDGRDRYIIKKGEKPVVGHSGEVIVTATNLRDGKVHAVSMRDNTSLTRALGAVLRSELFRQGFREFDIRRTNDGQPYHINNIGPLGARRYLYEAEKEMRSFLAEGFVTGKAQEPDAFNLDGAVQFAEAAKLLYPEHFGVIDAMAASYVVLRYEGDDQVVRKAIFEDKVNEIEKKYDNPERVLSSLALDGLPFSERNPRPVSLDAAVDTLRERLQDRFSLESAYKAACVRVKRDFGAEFSRQVRMKMTGCSDNQASHSFLLSVSDPDNPSVSMVHNMHTARIRNYHNEMNAWQSRPALGRLFSKKPKFPADDLVSLEKDLGKVAEMSSTAVRIHEYMTGISDDTLSGELLSEYDAVAKDAKEAVQGLPGGDKVRELANGIIESQLAARERFPDLWRDDRQKKAAAEFRHARRAHLRAEQEPALENDGRTVPVKEYVERSLSRFGVDKAWIDASYDRMLDGERLLFSGEISSSAGKKNVHVNVGLDEKGTIILYHPETGEKIGPAKTFFRSGTNLDFGSEGKKEKAREQGRKVSVENDVNRNQHR